MDERLKQFLYGYILGGKLPPIFINKDWELPASVSTLDINNNRLVYTINNTVKLVNMVTKEEVEIYNNNNTATISKCMLYKDNVVILEYIKEGDWYYYKVKAIKTNPPYNTIIIKEERSTDWKYIGDHIEFNGELYMDYFGDLYRTNGIQMSNVGVSYGLPGWAGKRNGGGGFAVLNNELYVSNGRNTSGKINLLYKLNEAGTGLINLNVTGSHTSLYGAYSTLITAFNGSIYLLERWNDGYDYYRLMRYMDGVIEYVTGVRSYSNLSNPKREYLTSSNNRLYFGILTINTKKLGIEYIDTTEPVLKDMENITVQNISDIIFKCDMDIFYTTKNDLYN